MSIIIGIVTHNCALVACDGRISTGALFEKDKRIKDSKVIRDNFDKTFVLEDNKVIGVVAGTMSFESKSIGEHLKELYTSKQKLPETSIEDLCESLKGRLTQITSNEIAFTFRKLDLILITSVSGKHKNMKIQARRFYPNSDNTLIEIEKSEIYPKIQGQVAWQLYGDDSSQKTINKFLETEIQKISSLDEKALRSLLYKAIRLGIKESEKSKDGNYLNCGGKVFVKSIK
jgi:hypothetical protein